MVKVAPLPVSASELLARLDGKRCENCRDSPLAKMVTNVDIPDPTDEKVVLMEVWLCKDCVSRRLDSYKSKTAKRCATCGDTFFHTIAIAGHQGKRIECLNCLKFGAACSAVGISPYSSCKLMDRKVQNAAYYTEKLSGLGKRADEKVASSFSQSVVVEEKKATTLKDSERVRRVVMAADIPSKPVLSYDELVQALEQAIRVSERLMQRFPDQSKEGLVLVVEQYKDLEAILRLGSSFVTGLRQTQMKSS